MSIIVSVSNDPLLLTPTLNQGQENMCVKCNRTQKKKGKQKKTQLENHCRGNAEPIWKTCLQTAHFCPVSSQAIAN